ncbi:hypothetical protein BT96DRAFT_769639, partial [Gymnopus androsaceus JB14]
QKRKSPIYAFFNAEPDVEFDDASTASYIVFHCSTCRAQVKQDLHFLGALIRHAKSCWGEEAVNAVQGSKSIDKARDALKKFRKKSQSKLTAALRSVKGWAESFSTQPPKKRRSACPFHIVKDCCYQWLQKEGRPEWYIPSQETVSHDVKKLYTSTKEKLAEELQ